MSGKLAIVFCVHHKPWLMMATLLTLLSQEHQDADLFFVYNVGDGESSRESYGEYRRIAARVGANAQLSPFDERVRDVCQLRGRRFVELEYENDHGLDSGAWYKFIRDGRWRDYEYVLFAGEGLLLAHPHVLPALVSFADRRRAHFIASGHEKRRIPRPAMDRCYGRGLEPTALDTLHIRMIAETFGIFARDPDFQAAYDRWDSGRGVRTEHHVPGVTTHGALMRKVRARIQQKWGSPFADPDVSWPGRVIRRVPPAVDLLTSRARIRLGGLGVMDSNGGAPMAYLGGGYEVHPAEDAREFDIERGVAFHRVDAPEWFGCTVIHLMSRDLLERFSERLNRFEIYDALDLPFAGSVLEVIWGFLPAWLGFDKWFANGFHRVREHFSTYRREDYPPEMASYINRYHSGRLAVGWQGDYLKLRAWRADLGDLRQMLPAAYF